MRITGAAAGAAYRALQADIAERIKAMCDREGVSLREISSRANMSPPTAGNYVKYPESMSINAILDFESAFPHLGKLRQEVINALCVDWGITAPDETQEADKTKRLRSKVLELQGLAAMLVGDMDRD